MIKIVRLPSGSPAIFLGKLKIHLKKSWSLDYDNLNGAFYLEIGPIEIKYKKDYKGHFIC